MSQRFKGMVTDSLLYSGLFLLLLFSITIPFLHLITIWMLPLPFFIYRVKHEGAAMALPVIYFGVLFLLFPLAIFVFFFLFAWFVGWVMGTVYRLNQAKGTDVVLGGIVSGAVALLAILVLGERFFGILKAFRGVWQQEMARTMQLMEEAGMGKIAFPPVEAFIPVCMLLFLIPLSLITFFAARRWLTRLGYPVKSLPPFYEWRLPRVFVTFYVILLLVEMVRWVMGEVSTNATWSLSIWWVLEFLFLIQGFAFVSFVLRLYRKSQAWLVLLLVLSIPAAILISIIGMLDAALDIRNRLAEMRKK